MAEPVLAINVDTSALRGEAAAATADMNAMVETAGRVVGATERVERKTKDTAAAFERLERQLDPTAAKLANLNRRYEQNVNLVTAAGAAVGVSADRQAAALTKLTAQHEAQTARLTRATTGAAAAMVQANDNAAGSNKRLGGALQQVGYQVGDVATQVLAGGDAMKAIAMQAGQLLGFFGPAGALAGMAVTVGAAVFGMVDLGDATDDTREASKLFADVSDRLNGVIDDRKTSVEELTKAYNKQTKAQQDLQRLDLQMAQTDIFKARKQQLDDATKQMEQYFKATSNSFLGINLDPFQGQTVQSQAQRMLNAGQLTEAVALLSKGDAEAQKLAGSLTATVREWTKQGETLAIVTAQLALYNGTATKAQKELLGIREETDLATEAQDRFAAALDKLKKAAAEGDAMLRSRAQFSDVMEDSERFMRDQADGISAAERAYQPYAAAIERLNDLKGKEGRTTLELIGIEQRLGELRAAGRQAMDEATAAEEKRRTAIIEEIDALRVRNDLLAAQVAGTDTKSIRRQVVELDIKSDVERFAASLKSANGELSAAATLEVERYERERRRRAGLEDEIELLDRAKAAGRSAADLFTSMAEGDWTGTAEGVADLIADFKDFKDITGSVSQGFAELGNSLLDSAAAGQALGNLVGELFGERSEHQQRNAQIGSTVATTIGDFFGVPKGLSSFVGNVVGNRWGPGRRTRRPTLVIVFSERKAA
ncbi:hypothetical protein [Niveispirillum sp. KHB5.9]|uniref:hypothetical protein n=1 Tax=Niveispirillum sp. KHB5.9 TaxID=3400269 RepID=UPI003A8C5134